MHRTGGSILASRLISSYSVPKSMLGHMNRASVPRHEIEFICKIGRLDREAAIALLQKHQGDREAVFSELASRRSRLRRDDQP